MCQGFLSGWLVSYAACFIWSLLSLPSASFRLVSATLRPSSSCLCRAQKEERANIAEPARKQMTNLMLIDVVGACMGLNPRPVFVVCKQRRPTKVHIIEGEIDTGGR